MAVGWGTVKDHHGADLNSLRSDGILLLLFRGVDPKKETLF
jgi:hypothetical protein